MILNKKKSKKPYVITAATIGLLVVGYMVTAYIVKLPPFLADSKPTPKVGEQTVNLERSDAEEQAIKDLENNPERKIQNDQNDVPAAPAESSSGKSVVNVLLTNVGVSNGTVSASGFVTNLTESGGACTYTFTSGSNKLTKSSATLVNPTSTTCQTISFPATELSSGTWKVVLSYSSSNAEGLSSRKEFTK